MIEKLVTHFARHVHARGVDRMVAWVYPPRCNAPRFIRGVRLRGDGLHMDLDSRQLIDRSVLFHGEYEPELRQLFERLLGPGAIAIDVGANIGVHTLTMARLVGDTGRVLAFEPNPPIRERLERNIALNALAQVTVYACALGASSARMDLRVPSPDSAEAANPGMASLVALDTPHDLVKVDVRALDDVLAADALARVDVVKIDVQGYECDVLEGMRNIVERFRPAVIFEYEDWAWQDAGRALIDFTHYLPESVYRYYRIVGGRTPDLGPFDPQSTTDTHVNIAAMPRDRAPAAAPPPVRS